MRASNVKISMEIPVPFNCADENDVMYSNRSFEEACNEATGKPIEIINSDGSSTVVGVATEVTYIKDDTNGDYIHVTGTLYHGGTSEQVNIDKGVVTDVKLSSIGITI